MSHLAHSETDVQMMMRINLAQSPKQNPVGRKIWFVWTLAILFAMAALGIPQVFGAIPSHIPKDVTDDRKLYRQIKPLKLKKIKISTDSGVKWLARRETRYQEKLPLPGRLMGPVKNIERKAYRYSGSKKSRSAPSNRPTRH